MTTIAYKDGVIAADSQVNDGDMIAPEKCKKLHKLADGSVYAFTGLLAHGMELLSYLTDPEGSMPCWSGGATIGIIARPNGKVYTYEGRGPWLKVDGNIGAWGSGQPYALGALLAGADAVKAVKIAKKLDPSTGGAVKSIVVKAAKPAKAKQ